MLKNWPRYCFCTIITYSSSEFHSMNPTGFNESTWLNCLFSTCSSSLIPTIKDKHEISQRISLKDVPVNDCKSLSNKTLSK